MLWRHAPWWAAATVPWVFLGFGLGSAPGSGLGFSLPVLAPLGVLCLAFAWLRWRVQRRVARSAPRWLNTAVPALEDSSTLLMQAHTPVARLQQQRLWSRLHAVVTPAVLASVEIGRAHV